MGEPKTAIERDLERFAEACRQFNEAMATAAEPALLAYAEIGRRFTEAIHEGIVEMERRLREPR